MSTESMLHSNKGIKHAVVLHYIWEDSPPNEAKKFIGYAQNREWAALKYDIWDDIRGYRGYKAKKSESKESWDDIKFLFATTTDKQPKMAAALKTAGFEILEGFEKRPNMNHEGRTKITFWYWEFPKEK